MDPDRIEIVTFVEATEAGNVDFGFESHGMSGDVIIYRKNGGSDIPVIHRVLLRAVANASGGWDVPGTTLRNVSSITWTLDYPCYPHGNLSITDWIPLHEGYLTTGDNARSNGCTVDQIIATGGNHGLTDENGKPVQAVKDEWVVGIASTEIPWLGAAKLFFSGTSSQVTDTTWRSLLVVIAVIISVPYLLEVVIERRETSTEEE
jgi:hypothetical protein